MKKFVLVLTLLAFPALAGDKEICLKHIQKHNQKATITSMNKIDIIDYYRIVDTRRSEIRKIITAACIEITSKACVNTTAVWSPVLKLYDERVKKIKSFALESNSTYYDVKTNRYNYICGVSGNKSVAVVNNK